MSAVRDWKNGFTEFQSPYPDRKKAMELLQSGDKLRMEALAEFDGKYFRDEKGR